MVVACIKCEKILPPGEASKKIKELNLRTIPDITNAIKAGGACASCHHAPGGLQDLLDEAWGRQPAAGGPPPPVVPRTETPAGASSFQRFKQIEQVIAQSVRPALQHDGGDIEVVDIKDNLVYCRLSGACAGCMGAQATLKMMVERTLKEEVSEQLRVIAV